MFIHGSLFRIEYDETWIKSTEYILGVGKKIRFLENKKVRDLHKKRLNQQSAVFLHKSWKSKKKNEN